MNASKQIAEQMIIISIDSYENKSTVGWLWHGYKGREIRFNSLIQMILNINKVLDDLNFPEENVKHKRFVKPDSTKSDTEYSPVEVTEPSYGALATFKLKILFRQNASWQGTVTWVDNRQEQSFRSALELIMLMNSALTYADELNSAQIG